MVTQTQWSWVDPREKVSETRERISGPMAKYRENDYIFLAAPSAASGAGRGAECWCTECGRSRLWLVILASAALSAQAVCVLDAGYWCGQVVRAERKKVWQEWGLESPFLILRLVHSELNIMVLVVPSWDDARWLCQDCCWEHLSASCCPVVIAVHISKAAFSVIPVHVHFYIFTFVLFFSCPFS